MQNQYSLRLKDMALADKVPAMQLFMWQRDTVGWPWHTVS